MSELPFDLFLTGLVTVISIKYIDDYMNQQHNLFNDPSTSLNKSPHSNGIDP